MFTKKILTYFVLGGYCVPVIPMGSKTLPELPRSQNKNLAIAISATPTTSNNILVVDPSTGQRVAISINARIPGRDDTYMHVIAASGNDEHMEQLISKRGGDMETRNVRGDTPLHIAVLEGRLLMVGRLLINGANPCAQNMWGLTPLDLARGLLQKTSARKKLFEIMAAMLEFFAVHRRA